MSAADDNEERELRIELMETQIDKNRLDLDRIRQQMKWEPWKALAAIIAAAAAMLGVAAGLAHFIR